MNTSRAKKTTRQQFQKMLAFARDNKMVVSGKGTMSTVEKARKLWQQFATEVNSLGIGPQKSANQWRHVFNEWKMNVKRKKRRILHESRDGSSTHRGLSEIEEQLLELISNCHLGNNKTQDTLPFPSAASNNSLVQDNFVDVLMVGSSSSCETSENQLTLDDTVKIEIVEEMLKLEPIEALLPAISVPTRGRVKEKSPNRFSSSSLREACEEFVHAQDVGIELEQARTESLGALNSTLAALVEVQRDRAATEKERAATEKGKLKLKYFTIHKTFRGFDKFYSEL